MRRNYCEQMKTHDNSLNRKPVPKPVDESSMRAHLRASLPAKYVHTSDSFPHKLLSTLILHWGTTLVHWNPCNDHMHSRQWRQEPTSQTAMMNKLRSSGITDLVEKRGWTITGVFVRSYAITDATLPCASDTHVRLLLLPRLLTLHYWRRLSTYRISRRTLNSPICTIHKRLLTGATIVLNAEPRMLSSCFKIPAQQKVVCSLTSYFQIPAKQKALCSCATDVPQTRRY